jgi:hypothetical protein
MVELVETMVMADSLQPTAYGPGENQIRVAECAASGRRLAAFGMRRR